MDETFPQEAERQVDNVFQVACLCGTPRELTAGEKMERLSEILGNVGNRTKQKAEGIL